MKRRDKTKGRNRRNTRNSNRGNGAVRVRLDCLNLVPNRALIQTNRWPCVVNLKGVKG